MEESIKKVREGEEEEEEELGELSQYVVDEITALEQPLIASSVGGFSMVVVVRSHTCVSYLSSEAVVVEVIKVIMITVMIITALVML
ncbi:hypothetical protein E2C01_082867 [Portunus trituberculatus]|uniref:Uncharacterized protein n=1 Tax=Portunus trituberculatus TaxID=210409 RepID=A0A5B7J079_PORTR|nr:hypothetical protein [Portunus trituberculatus]